MEKDLKVQEAVDVKSKIKMQNKNWFNFKKLVVFQCGRLDRLYPIPFQPKTLVCQNLTRQASPECHRRSRNPV